MLWIVLFLLGAANGFPSIAVVRPQEKEVFNTQQVEIVIRVSDFKFPTDGVAELYINKVLAFQINQDLTTLMVPLLDGFHQVKAILSNKSHTIFETEIVRILVDTEDEDFRSIGRFRPFLPEERGRVSVIIASHDRYDLLIESIESVRQQTYDDWELIVVNDASTDLRYYNLMEDVIMIHLPYNMGRPGLVRNIGVAAASGEWLAFLDDDDIWVPHKLEVQLDAVHRFGLNMSSACFYGVDKNAGQPPHSNTILGTDALAGNGSFVLGREYQWWLRDAHGPYAVRSTMQTLRQFGAVNDDADRGISVAVDGRQCLDFESCLPDVWDRFVIQLANFVITSSVLIRRDTLFSSGPFNNKTLGEDHDLWKSVLSQSTSSLTAFVRQPMVYWRIDGPAKLTQSWKT